MHAQLKTAAVVSTAIVAVFASACGGRADGESGEAPGVTDDSITIGTSMPLSGPLAANGMASLGAAQAYFEAVNAAGGVKMSDGKTRTIDFVHYDDGYAPAKAVQNYQRLVNSDQVFALFHPFGTATNLAIMAKATADKVPEAFVNAGDAVFSDDREANPWTIGWQPTYESEGKAYGEFLAAKGKPLTVAVLRQADTFGEIYLKGFKAGIAGSAVKVVKEATYVPSDASVDGQVSSLSGTDADVLFLAMAISPLASGAANHAFTLDWNPIIILSSVTSGISQTVLPGKLDNYPELYSSSFVKRADDPSWSDDPAVVEMVDNMKKYAPDANPSISNAPYTYAAAAALVEALGQMEEISRQGLMDTLNSLKTDDIPILLPGIGVDGTDQESPPVSGLRIQHFQNGSWTLVEE